LDTNSGTPWIYSYIGQTEGIFFLPHWVLFRLSLEWNIARRSIIGNRVHWMSLGHNEQCKSRTFIPESRSRSPSRSLDDLKLLIWGKKSSSNRSSQEISPSGVHCVMITRSRTDIEWSHVFLRSLFWVGYMRIGVLDVKTITSWDWDNTACQIQEDGAIPECRSMILDSLNTLSAIRLGIPICILRGNACWENRESTSFTFQIAENPILKDLRMSHNDCSGVCEDRVFQWNYGHSPFCDPPSRFFSHRFDSIPSSQFKSSHNRGFNHTTTIFFRITINSNHFFIIWLNEKLVQSSTHWKRTPITTTSTERDKSEVFNWFTHHWQRLMW
jgi:hypothetical protein